MTRTEQDTAHLMTLLEEVQEAAERADQHVLAHILGDVERLWLVGMENQAHAVIRPLGEVIREAAKNVGGKEVTDGA